MDIEVIVERIALASLIPGFVWLFITMFVFRNSEIKDGKFSGWLNFWPFYDVMKESHPVGSQWGRRLTYIGVALILPWVLWIIMGY